MKQSGFTLIELLLVLSIIGIISAIAIPAMLGQRESARNRATASNAAHIKAALIAAINELDRAPAERALDLVAAVNSAEILTAMAARGEYNAALPNSARNPFDRALPAYRFNQASPTVGGEVSISVPTPNATTGLPEIQIGYGAMKKGVADLTPRIGSVDAAR